jgi:hypothetical protein
MLLSAVIFLALALWIILWAFGLGGMVSFLPALAIILVAIAVSVARSGSEAKE